MHFPLQIYLIELGLQSLLDICFKTTAIETLLVSLFQCHLAGTFALVLIVIGELLWFLKFQEPSGYAVK